MGNNPVFFNVQNPIVLRPGMLIDFGFGNKYVISSCPTTDDLGIVDEDMDDMIIDFECKSYYQECFKTRSSPNLILERISGERAD